ncbi:MAG: hypothetical protein KAS36_02505, partial [Anaerolineales bacterium]|nr:hypothetical protein [Anaerolineales bacterium]
MRSNPIILSLIILCVFAQAQSWIELSPTGGPIAARNNHTSVYDPNTNQMIVYDGRTGVCCGTEPIFNDVWVLQNANGLDATIPAWTQLSPTGGPPT